MDTIDWKKGRGKLGPFTSLLGHWRHEEDSPRGPMVCEKVFSSVLDGKYIELRATWRFSGPKAFTYDDFTLFGPDADAGVKFWSFTSDGKRSEGWLSTAEDLHPNALAFEADMPAGRARQAYFPHAEGGLGWVVGAKVKAGWSVIADHQYARISD